MAKLSGITATSVTWQEGAAPATPASTKWTTYFKTDGLYYIDDAGAETGPLAAGSSGIVPWALMPYFGGVNTTSISVGAANRAIYIPTSPLQAAATITGVQIHVVVQSGNISVGLYNSAGSRVATSGAVACPAAGLAVVAFSASYSAAAGTYYLAISADNTTATFASGNSGTPASPATCRFEETAHPLPATATFNGTPTGRSIIIVGRVSGGFP